MKCDSEKDGARLAAKDDERITKVGKILRATHLDELPQVFNILYVLHSEYHTTVLQNALKSHSLFHQNSHRNDC